MPTLDIKQGYCNPLLAMLEEYWCIQTDPHTNLGMLTALTSPENDVPSARRIRNLYDENGALQESCLRWYMDTHCDSDFACDPLNPITVCDTQPEPAGPEYEDVDVGTPACWEFSLEIDPCALKDFCHRRNREERIITIDQQMKQLIKQVNRWAVAQIDALPGGIYDPQTGVVSAPGTVASFEILGPSGQPSAIGFNDFRRFAEYNGCSTPLVVHGLGPLDDYARLQNVGAYCCNNDGIQLDRLVALMGMRNYVDTSFAAELGPTDALAWEPGSIYLRNYYEHRGECLINEPNYKQSRFIGPFGLIFDYYWTFQECPKPVYREHFKLQLELMGKPIGINHCEMLGTNGIFNLEFLSCADNLCA